MLHGLQTMGMCSAHKCHRHNLKKSWEAAYLSDRVHSRGCQESTAKEETYTEKTCSVDGSIKNHCASWIVASTIHVDCNSLKAVLTEENKWARVEMALHFRDPEDPTKYQDMCDWIHLDEKWFFLIWEKERYILLLEEKNPKWCKTQITCH